jgi:hypothetical protein
VRSTPHGERWEISNGTGERPVFSPRIGGTSGYKHWGTDHWGGTGPRADGAISRKRLRGNLSIPEFRRFFGPGAFCLRFSLEQVR